MLEEAKADLATPSDIPGPYFEVTVLDLTVNWTRDRVSKEGVLLTITKAFDVTMSPTMEVQWVSASGETHSAILNFFDRSYGDFRMSHWSTYPENSASIEACWQRYVQSGQVTAIFNYMEAMDRDEGEGIWDLGSVLMEYEDADTADA